MKPKDTKSGDSEQTPCRFCGKAKDNKKRLRHERFCTENPDRTIPIRDSNPNLQDPRISEPEGITSIAPLTPLLGQDKPSTEITKDLELAELRSREFAKGLNIQQARKFAENVKKSELLKGIGIDSIQQGNGQDQSFIGGMADELRKMRKDNLQFQIFTHEAQKAGLLPQDNGNKKDEDEPSWKHIMFMDRKDAQRAKEDQTDKIIALERQRDRDAHQFQLKLLGEQINKLSAGGSKKDMTEWVAEMKKTHVALNDLFGSKEKSTGELASEIIGTTIESIKDPIIIPFLKGIQGNMQKGSQGQPQTITREEWERLPAEEQKQFLPTTPPQLPPDQEDTTPTPQESEPSALNSYVPGGSEVRKPTAIPESAISESDIHEDEQE